MPYYLSSKKIPTRTASPGRPLDQGWVPVGCHPDDCPKEDRKWIWLSTLSDDALVLLRNLNSDKDLDLLADFGRERVSPSTRNKLDHYLGDRNVEDANFNDVISNVFRDPPVDGRWGKALRPNKGRGRYEIHLQLPDDPLVFWEGASARRVPKTVTLTDNFNRAAGDLAGSTISGGGGTWVENDGSSLRVDGPTQTVAVGALTNGGWYTAQVAANLDTDDHYAQLDMENWTSGALQAIGVGVRIQGAQNGTNEGYYFQFDANPIGHWEVRNWKTDVALDSGTVTISLPDTIYLEMDGSTWTAKFNGGTVDFGTSTLFVGHLRGGIQMFDGANLGNLRADNFISGDLTVTPTTPLDVPQLGFTQRLPSRGTYEMQHRRRSY